MDVLEDLCGRDALTALITGVDLPHWAAKKPHSNPQRKTLFPAGSITSFAMGNTDPRWTLMWRLQRQVKKVLHETLMVKWLDFYEQE